MVDPTLPVEALIAAAIDHDVLGLCAAGLRAGRGGALAPEAAEALDIWCEGQAIAARQAASALAALLHRLADHGIPTMPFKGPLLADAFPDPSLRTCRDLDVFVPAHAVEATLACLVADGFAHEPGLGPVGIAALRRYAGEYILFRQGRLPVEPHWLPAPRTMAFDLDMAAIWRRARPGRFRGAPCLLPTPEDHLLLLALHGGKEQWHKLKWIADIAAVLRAHPALDLAAIRRDAGAWGCRRAVDLAMLLAHRLFGTPATPADAVTHRLASQVLARLDATAEPPDGPYVVTRFHWALRERWTDRFRYAARTVLTPRVAHYRRLPLPSPLRWLLVPLKLPWDYVLTPLLKTFR